MIYCKWVSFFAGSQTVSLARQQWHRLDPLHSKPAVQFQHYIISRELRITWPSSALCHFQMECVCRFSGTFSWSQFDFQWVEWRKSLISRITTGTEHRLWSERKTSASADRATLAFWGCGSVLFTFLVSVWFPATLDKHYLSRRCSTILSFVIKCKKSRFKRAYLLESCLLLLQTQLMWLYHTVKMQ